MTRAPLCPHCNDPDGWVEGADGLLPCQWCKPDTHQRWKGGECRPGAPDRPRGDTEPNGKRPPATMSPPVETDPIAVHDEFARRYGRSQR